MKYLPSNFLFFGFLTYLYDGTSSSLLDSISSRFLDLSWNKFQGWTGYPDYFLYPVLIRPDINLSICRISGLQISEAGYPLSGQIFDRISSRISLLWPGQPFGYPDILIFFLYLNQIVHLVVVKHVWNKFWPLKIIHMIVL